MRASNSIYSLFHHDIRLLRDSLKSVEDELNKCMSSVKLQKEKVSDAVDKLEIIAGTVHDISETDYRVKAQSWSKRVNFGALNEPTTLTDKNIEAGIKKTKSKSLNVQAEDKCQCRGQFTSSVVTVEDIGEMIKGLRDSVAGKDKDKDEINIVDTFVEELSTTRPSITNKFWTKNAKITPTELHDVGTGVHLLLDDATDEESRLSPPVRYQPASQQGTDVADIVVKTMALSTFDAGVIIGIKGCMVNKIRRMSGAQIDITGSSKEEVKTVVIKGRRNHVRKALEIIHKSLKDTVVARLTSSSDAGVIIGEKGCRINELKRSTSTYIHVRRRPGGSQIEVTGMREQVDKAMETIKQLTGDDGEFVILKL